MAGPRRPIGQAEIALAAAAERRTASPATSAGAAHGQRATRGAFFIAGFGTAAWAPLVPYARHRLGLDPGALGLVLLCLGVGAITTMPLAGAFTARCGCRRAIAAAGVLLAASLPFLALVTTPPALASSLLAFGAGFGTLGVAINVQAVLVEQAAGRALMSGFHGLFSVGGIAGAGGMTGLLATGVSPGAAALAVALTIVALLLAFRRGLLSDGGDPGAPVLARPRGPVLAIGALCFVVFLAEGAMLDWSAVTLTALQGVAPAHAGFGYAAFAVAMATGRLSGDRVVARLGGRRLVAAGGVCAALGLAVAVLASAPLAAGLGFAAVGLGSSNIVPALYSVLGRQTVMPANAAVAAVTTLGFSGILIGPALIGFVAELTSLTVAFGAVAAALLVVAANARLAAK